MRRPPPVSTRTYTLFTSSNLFLSLYRAMARGDSCSTFDECTGAGRTCTRSSFAGYTTRIITAINNSADSAYYMGLLNGNGDGTITDDELGAYQFDSTAGNPTGQVNNYRIRQSGQAPYPVPKIGRAQV